MLARVAGSATGCKEHELGEGRLLGTDVMLSATHVWQTAVHCLQEIVEMAPVAYAAKRSARLDARVSHKEKDLIETAAKLRRVRP
jgi:hypothetical protein